VRKLNGTLVFNNASKHSQGHDFLNLNLHPETVKQVKNYNTVHKHMSSQHHSKALEI